MVCVRVRTENAEVEQKDAFYEKLRNEFEKIPRHDVKIVIGDFNAKFRKEKTFMPGIKIFSKIFKICVAKIE